MQQAARMYTGDLPAPSSFQYKEGGTSVYYTFNAGAAPSTETVVFFYGGTGCASWTVLMPEYFSGLTINSRVYALNKQFVSDRSLGQYDCGEDFKLANNPRQWVVDYAKFNKLIISVWHVDADRREESLPLPYALWLLGHLFAGQQQPAINCWLSNTGGFCSCAPIAPIARLLPAASGA